jgi:diguanylate cyclase (GGDEF)-like protein
MEWLKSLPRAVVFAAALVFMGITAFASMKTQAEIRFSFFYLIPISLVSWLVGRRSGVLIAAGSAVMWLMASVAEGGWNFSREPTVYLNTLLLASFFLASALLLSALRAALDREKALARTDPLTGLGNRRAFEERVDLEIQRAARFNRPLTLALIDVDDFKAINDRQGHAAGDRVLVLLADRLRSNLRSIDLISRVGGDEFVALFTETDVAAARAAVFKLLNETRNQMTEKGIAVGFSVGVVTFGSAPDSVSTMMKAVDDLMYRAKQSGKNQVVFRLAEAPIEQRQ